MSDIDDLLTDELRKLPVKPASDSKQPEKKRYSELMSAAAARAFAEALRSKGLTRTLPLLAQESPQGTAARGSGHGDEEADSR